MRTSFDMNEIRIPSSEDVNTLLINVPNTYLSEREWALQDCLEADKGMQEMQEEHFQALDRLIHEYMDAGQKVYIRSKSVPKHLDMFYYLNAYFPDTVIGIEPKSKQVADALTEMGYIVYGPHMKVVDTRAKNPSLIVGQEDGKKGFKVVDFDRYSLHATPGETASLIRQLQPKEVYLLHVGVNPNKQSIGEYLSGQGFAASVTQAENESKYYLKQELTMKHEVIFKSEMLKAMDLAEARKDERQMLSDKLKYEWAVIYGSLVYPQLHPRDAYRAILDDGIVDAGLSYDAYLNGIRNVNLDSQDKREYILGRAEEVIAKLKEALDGDVEAIKAFSSCTENLNPRDRRRRIYFLGKYFVLFMMLIDPDLKDMGYLPIAQNFSARDCDRLLRQLRDSLYKEYDLKKEKRSAKDVLKKTEEALLASSESMQDGGSGDEFERLRFLNENYRNSLELVQAMLDELNETIDESAEEAKSQAVASFYTLMNSDEYGNLLDSLELVEQRLAELKKNRVKTPPQFLPLTIVFKQMIRFIKECGVTAIDQVGREFETRVEGLSEYTYIGEAYSEPGETKLVVVEKPGWKYGSTIISLPTVREKED